MPLPRIGTFLIPTDPYWVQVLEAIIHTSEKIGVELVVLQPAISRQVLYSIPPEEIVDLVLAQELDAIICAAGSIPVLELLTAKNLPVICLDEIDLQHPFITVTESLYEGGRLAGEYIARALGGRGHALCITAAHEESILAGQSRHLGFHDALQRFPGISTNHVGAFWRFDQAYPALLKTLENYPRVIDAIFGVSDTLILAAREAGYKLGVIGDQTLLVGLNGDPLALAGIAEGTLSATVDTGAADLGERAVSLAYQGALGGSLPPILHYQFQLITKDNVASVATRKLTAIAGIPTHMVGYSRVQEHERLSQLEISTEITNQIGSLTERDRVAEIFSTAVSQHYGFEWVRILRWSELDRTLVLFGGDESPAAEHVPIDQDRLVQDAFHSNQVIFIHDTRTSQRWQLGKEFELIRSRAILPIQLGSRVIGVLDLQSSRPVRHLSLEIVGLRLLASQLGIVIQNFELYQQALEAREAAEKANQLKTRLIANVGHEMRSPLNAILGFSQSIENQVETDSMIATENLVRDAKQIYKSGEHLMHMIDDLLDLSRAEIGALSLYFEQIQPVPFLEELFCNASQSDPISSHIRWNLEVPKRLPVIRADPVRLRQILFNLLTNARKFTRAGCITLGAAAEPPYLHFWVRDTGQGIPVEHQAKIFEPFAAHERKHRPEGIGLGLSITRHLVALHGGTITLESRAGSGSTFNIYLPLPGISKEPTSAPRDTDVNLMLIVSNHIELPNEVLQICERQSLVPVPISDRTDLDEALAKGMPRAIAWDLQNANSKEWALIHRIGSNPECAALPFLLFSTENGKTPGHTGLTQVLVKPCPINTLEAWIGSVGAEIASTGPILIVDDDPECRSLHQKILSKSYRENPILLAESGRDALEILQVQVPALILLDLMMPDLDGFAVLEWVRSNERTRNIPVIVLSGKLLNYEDIQRLNYFKTIFASKGILSDSEMSDFFLRLSDELGILPQPTSILVKQALAFMHQNYGQSIHRMDIAAAVGVHPNYLSRIFHQEMSISPVDYLNRWRIQRAKEFLVQSPAPITQISSQVGFNDPAYFSRVFQKLTGQSPQEFRYSKM